MMPIFWRSIPALFAPRSGEVSDRDALIIHPLAWPANSSGACGMHSGDWVVYDLDGRHCRLDEALHDGDAFVTFEDGSHETVHWNHLSPEK